MTSVDASSGTAYAGRDANHAHSFRQFNASKHAQYFTPTWLAELLCDVLQPLVPPRGPGELAVLDPTCGSGRLLEPWKRVGAEVLGIELDDLAADHARFALGTTNVRTGDILDYRHLLKAFRSSSRIRPTVSGGRHRTPGSSGRARRRAGRSNPRGRRSRSRRGRSATTGSSLRSSRRPRSRTRKTAPSATRCSRTSTVCCRSPFPSSSKRSTASRSR